MARSVFLAAALCVGAAGRNHSAILREAKATHDERLREHRGRPWLEYVAARNGSADVAGFLAERNATMEASLSVLPAALEEAQRLESRLSLPGLTRRWPASLHVRGTFFITAAFKLAHDAEQVRHLVDGGSLPRGFLALADAYEAELARVPNRTKPSYTRMQLLGPEAYAGLWGAHNTLVALPEQAPWARGEAALGAGFLSRAAAIEAAFVAGQEKGARFPTSKAHISVVFHSFWLIFGRAIISRNGLEA